MKGIISILIVFMLMCVPAVYAEDGERQLIKDFAECQGMYKAFARTLERAGLTDSVEAMKGYMRGAKLAGAFISAKIALEDKPHQVFKYGDFFEYMDSLAHGSYTRVLSYMEIMDKLEVGKVEIGKITLKCNALNKLQSQLIDELRKSGALYGK